MVPFYEGEGGAHEAGVSGRAGNGSGSGGHGQSPWSTSQPESPSHQHKPSGYTMERRQGSPHLTHFSIFLPSSSASPLVRPLSSTSIPGSSQSPLFTSSSIRSTGPLASLRARQIQADEGILMSPYRPPVVRQVSGNVDQLSSATGGGYEGSRGGVGGAEEGLSSGGSRLFRGRARAGTLPSSWSNVLDQPRSTPSPVGGQRQLSGSGDASTRTTSRPWSNSTSFASHSDLPMTMFSAAVGDPAANNSRSTSASSSPLISNHPQGLTSSAAFPSNRLVPSRQMRSNSALEFDRAGIFPHILPDPAVSGLHTSSPGSEAESNANRHRSSSLASSAAGLGNNPFGPSIFTSTWGGDTKRISSTGVTRPSSSLSHTMTPSTRDDRGYVETEDYNVQREHLPLHEDVGRDTLDYLGLDQEDNAGQRMGPAGPLRVRASTLASVPPRAYPAASADHQSSFADDRLHGEEREGQNNGDGDGSFYASYALEHGIDAAQLAAMVSAVGLPVSGHGSLQQGRNRAGTVAALGGPGGRQRIEHELMRMAALGNQASLNGLGINSLLHSLRAASTGGEYAYSKAPLEGFPHLDISTPPVITPNRSSPSTPAAVLKPSSHEGGPHPPWSTEPSSIAIAGASGTDANYAVPASSASRSAHQAPSRSLWIGNLDSNTTGQELMRMFAPYGAIESLRLLPEKECGFVNFVEMADAMQAREDVLGRLGARLENFGTGMGGTVRIGYGKIDAAAGRPAAPGGLTASARSPTDERTPHAYESGIDSGTITPGGLDGMGPTRALWVGGIPATVTSAILLSIFQPFGPIESARILTHKNCAFINFERVDDAVRARKMLNGRDVLGSEVGSMKIGFAKVPTKNVESYPPIGADSSQLEVAADALSSLRGAKSATKTAEQQIASGGIDSYRSNLVVNLLNQQNEEARGKASAAPTAGSDALHGPPLSLPIKHAATSSSSSIVPASDKGGVPLPAHMAPRPTMSDLQLLMGQLSAGQPEKEADVASVAEHRPSATYYMTIPLVSDVTSGRRFETTRLREARRSIESGQLDTRQCDMLAREYMDSIVDLASDYIGNTLVQKFFEYGSEQNKVEMLHRLAPHLAMTGCHKNGTWAAQKILDCCHTPEQVSLIAMHLRPYVPGLLLDQYGNYVVQGCLRWNQPMNDFVFDAMVDRCWEIAQGRFGARSMRACLERESVTDQQRKRVAIAIILNSIPLATSPNGAILLTWLMDTSGVAKSYRLLAPRFAPHLSHLCTHKLASTPVLRIVTQTFEPEARQMILDALFESEGDQVLEEVVIDQVHGSQFITKILATSSLSPQQSEKYSNQVRMLVEKHHLVGVPAYRRLCEDLGLLPVSGLSGSTALPERKNHTQSAGVQHGVPTPAPFAMFTTPPMGNSSNQSLSSTSPMAMRPPATMGAALPPDAFNPHWDTTSPTYKYGNPSG